MTVTVTPGAPRRRTGGRQRRRRPRRRPAEWRAAAKCTASSRTATRGGCGAMRRTWSTPSPSTRAGRALLGDGQQGQRLPDRIALAVHGAADRCRRPRSRHSRPAATAVLRRHGECGQGVRDRARPGARGNDRERRFDAGAVLAVGPAELRSAICTAARWRSRRAAAIWTSRRRTGARGRRPSRPRRAGAVASPPARFVQWKATLTAASGVARTGVGGRGLPAEERGAAHR